MSSVGINYFEERQCSSVVGLWVRQSRGGVVQGCDSLSPPGGRVVYQIFEGHIRDFEIFFGKLFFQENFFYSEWFNSQKNHVFEIWIFYLTFDTQKIFHEYRLRFLFGKLFFQENFFYSEWFNSQKNHIFEISIFYLTFDT